MSREAIDNWLERLILLLVLAGIGFGTLAFGGVRPVEFVVVWWLILGATSIWLVRIWLAPAFRFLWPPLCWAILPFVGYAVWRYFTADIEFVARQEMIQIVLGALLLVLVVNNLYSQESTRVLTFALVYLAMAVAMYGIYQWIRPSDYVWGQLRPVAYTGRASGSFICPNHLAGFLEMILPVGISMVILGRMGVVARIGVAYACLVIFTGMAATQSRAGWLAMGVSLLLPALYWLQRKKQRWLALVAVLCVLWAGYWVYNRTVAKRVQATMLTGHERDIRLRLNVAAWQMWKEDPWWGVGPAHFDYRYRQYREPVDKTQPRPGRVHNDYMNTLVDFGLAGFFLALLPLGVMAWSLVRFWPHLMRGGRDLNERKSNRTAIVLGGTAAVCALLVHSFFDFNMHIPSNAFLLVTLLGILAAHLRFATERYWFTARWPLALAGTVLLLGTLAYLVPEALRSTRQIGKTRQAERLEHGSPERLALLKAAFAADSRNFEAALAVGEQLRATAWMGAPGNELLAEEARTWFERAAKLNRWDVIAPVGVGMCLDWMGKHKEAEPYFAKALELDPNHWYTRGMMGWHAFQTGQFGEARDWMRRSLELNWTQNPLALSYLNLTEKILTQTNKPVLPY